ncbi:MAG: flagellar biosynthesis protein FlgD [Selenomonadaceae bacterium]|nr:flagellar biosynthesis protein FlgD [Selenomonadaceae bacterium]
MASSLNTINVNGVTYDAAAYEASKTEDTKVNNDLDKNAFLKLLITQLENQDPMDPQDNSEFVAEMAQFSSLEQMTNMNESLTKINTLVSNMDTSVLVGQLSGMIGKGVEWTNTVESADEEGKPVVTTENLSGVITGVTMADGVTKIIVQSGSQKHTVEIADISRVYELTEDTANDNANDYAEDLTPVNATNPMDALQTEMITGEA